jgi:malonyl-CoA/methylmalonyl-CoA synthetase
MRGRYRVPVPPLSWRHHLPAGADFDPAGDVRPAGLPATWARAWAAAPEARLLQGRAGPASSSHAPGAPGETRWLTAAELDERSRAVAAGLSAVGLPPGARVAWSPDRSPEAVISHVGALRAGLTVVPLNPALTARELAHVVEDARPVAALVPGHAQELAAGVGAAGVQVVLDHGLAPLAGGSAAHDVVGSDAVLDAMGGDAPALVCYTSGTTGAPKGAVLSHLNVLANSRALAAAWGWEPGDRLVHALPLFHGHGLCAALYTGLMVGASTVLLPAFEPAAVLDAVTEEHATLFFGVPTMYHRIAATGRADELRRLRLAVSGSAPLAPELHGRIKEAGTDVLERYGMTETLLTVSNPLHGERRPGTVGFPLPGVDAEVDPGSSELRVRGPQVFGGYLGRPQATAGCFEDGWFRTGDLAEVDDGYVRILGRTGDVVISGGFNVYPAEVEDVLLRHPDVAEVAVTGTPSEEWGEVVTAWVVPASGSVDADELLRFAAGLLAPYKRPRLVRVVPALPRNAMGKVLRSALS